MHQENPVALRPRRSFLKQAAALGGAAFLAEPEPARSQPPAASKNIGIAFYTVRDVMDSDFEGTVAKLAHIGYKEVEPANGYNKMAPKAFRAMLDRYGLSMPSTHTDYPSGTGAELERQLEAQQIMGIRYTEIRSTTTGGSPVRRARAPLSPGAYYNPSTGITYNSFTALQAFGPNQPRTTLAAAQQRAARLNADGKIAHKFGIKLFVHNHTGEFEKLLDSDRSEYDVLLAETDPDLVVMQIDLGWTSIAGQDPVEMFKKNPGRYELWHIKDVFGLRTVNPALLPNERISNMAFAPVGAGQIDYQTIFAHAQLAGMKHFVVEQDNAACFGDSLAAARVSYENLKAIV